MFLAILLNTYARTDKKENHKRFGKEINNADQNHKNQMIGLKNMSMSKTLDKPDDKRT